MARQDTSFDKPSHTPGTAKGEEWALHKTEPGRKGEGVTARFATGINPRKHDPIDPRMPHLTPP